VGVESRFFIREVIGNHMTEMGRQNEKIAVLTADLTGTCRIGKFSEEFPERFFNVGIAEQNMVSFAAGLAHEGMVPYVFSMAPFISMRACEQCRTDVAYARLNVRLMGTYAGCSGGISGATHWALEDCAIMGSMPGMTVLEPSDPIQARKMMEQTLKYDGPIYIRSSVEPVCGLYDESYEYEIGRASVARGGDDGTFICSGVVVQFAVEASKILERELNKKIRVVDMHTIKPIDEDAVIAAAETGKIVVGQDHNIIGGLGYYVAAVLANYSLNPKFKMLGIKDEFSTMAHAPYLYSKHGYDVDGLVKAMKDMFAV